jgi:hypothetical protein
MKHGGKTMKMIQKATGLLAVLVIFLLAVTSAHAITYVGDGECTFTGEYTVYKDQTLVIGQKVVRVNNVNEIGRTGEVGVTFAVTDTETGEYDFESLFVCDSKVINGVVIQLKDYHFDGTDLGLESYAYFDVLNEEEFTDIPIAETCSSTNYLVEGETREYLVDGREYQVTLNEVSKTETTSTTHGWLKINGEKVPGLAEGQGYTISDGTRITVGEVLYQDYAGGIKSVWFCFDGSAGVPLLEVPVEESEMTKPTSPADLLYAHKLFVDGERFNAFFVVGEAAPASDNLAMTDIAVVFDELGFDFVDVTKLDIEIESPFDSNVISVGKPCQNSVSNALLGYPFDCDNGLLPGEGRLTINDVNGYAQLVVDGHSWEDTRLAAKVLARYIEETTTGRSSISLQGKQVLISGSVDDPLVFTRDDVAATVCGDSYGGDGYYSACIGDVVEHELGIELEVVDFSKNSLMLSLVDTSFELMFEEQGERISFYFRGIPFTVEYNYLDPSNDRVTIYIEHGVDIEPSVSDDDFEFVERDTDRTTEVVPAPVRECKGCKQNGNCLPYGTRLVDEDGTVYCAISGNLLNQLVSGKECQNNYECTSNQCSNGKCQDLHATLEKTNSLLERILNWIERIFS